MKFKHFIALQQEHMKHMFEGAAQLFEVDADKDELWNLYLNSFPENENRIYRERRVHDCSACRQFVKRFGNVVSIKNGKLTTIWGFDANDSALQQVIDALDAHIKSKPVMDVFYACEKQIGTPHNTETTENGEIVWHHMNVHLPDAFVQSRRISEGEFKANFRDTRNVFKRSLDELSTYSVEVVQELIMQGTLYRGEEWSSQISKFLEYKRAYDALKTERARELFAWEKSIEAGIGVGRIKNHAIGTLLEDISNHTDLETAVRKYESVVAPANYMRPKAIFTHEMLLQAEKKATELGILDSLPRRFATAEDIDPQNLLFPPRHVIVAERAKKEKEQKQTAHLSGIFADMADMATSTLSKGGKQTDPAKLEHVETISIERFMSRVLPTAKKMDIYLENRHTANMVSLIAPQNPDAPSMFKWNNAFSWAYAGNVTDSIKENVAKAGGKVDGVLRFSIQWNDEGIYNANDFDAHCKLPCAHIYFGDKIDRSTGGNLDVDIIHPNREQVAVENITWPDKQRMKPGDYQFYVKCYSDRGGTTGFKAQIEFDGQVFEYQYPYAMRDSAEVPVATVTLDHSGRFTIRHHMGNTAFTRDVWNVETNTFIPVKMMMYSPNYWEKVSDEQEGVGNRHYFFMLDHCINPDSPNGFYNEFLDNRLIEHKRVFEALGARMKVEHSDEQLSGVGFSSTKRNSVIVRVTGVTERKFKIEF